jgi:hypothetical protein
MSWIHTAFYTSLELVEWGGEQGYGGRVFQGWRGRGGLKVSSGVERQGWGGIEGKSERQRIVVKTIFSRTQSQTYAYTGITEQL